MNASAYDAGRIALMLNELRLPTIGRLWPDFAECSDKEGWHSAETPRECICGTINHCVGQVLLSERVRVA
jgi:hypothetical protein